MNPLPASLVRSLALTALAIVASTALGAPPDVATPHYTLSLDRGGPRVAEFSIDSLGQHRFWPNPVFTETNAGPRFDFVAAGTNEFCYRAPGARAGSTPAWRITCAPQTIRFTSEFDPVAPAVPFVLALEQKSCHPTLLGRMPPGQRRMTLPCVLHLPDQGSMRITCDVAGQTLGYDARRFVKVPFVRVEFPAATAERPKVEYTLDVVALYPQLAAIEGDSRFDGFRRGFLNIFQVNPRMQMLANNASSDPVPFTLYEYSMVARRAPPLADGLSCLDLVRMTLDRYLAGVKGYGLVGYGVPPGEADLVAWNAPWNSLDSYPSLLLAACDYVEGSKDLAWGRTHYDQLAGWARAMLETDRDGNGLIEYPRTGNLGDRPTPQQRPANWWDTINFGHEDAYANALAYQACLGLARLADAVNRPSDTAWLTSSAATLRAAYRPAFLNPASGLLAGWKSADGQLHDYAFTFVSGVAATYGLLDPPDARAVLQRLLDKIRDVGFGRFDLGLPGNLVPIPKADYARHSWPNAIEVGEPNRDDGSDAFQRYENGGATGCFAYFTIHALYQAGLRSDARRILQPMLASYAAGQFQGFCASGKSKDWRDWSGGCHGYEGLLVDNYLPLLAVFDDTGASPP